MLSQETLSSHTQKYVNLCNSVLKSVQKGFLYLKTSLLQYSMNFFTGIKKKKPTPFQQLFFKLKIKMHIKIVVGFKKNLVENCR